MQGRCAIAGAVRAPRLAGRVVAASLLVATAGCADSSSNESAEATETLSTTESTSPEGSPSAAEVKAVDDEDAASALSDFACSPAVGVSERWTVAGSLTNDESAAVTYRVTVVVVGSTGIAGAGSESLVEVPAEATTDVDMARVRGPLDGTCQVQVLRVG